MHIYFSQKKSLSLILFLLLFSLKIIGQSTVAVTNKTSKEFLKSNKLNQPITLDNLDLALLKSTVFHLLNTKSKVAFKQSTDLAFITNKILQNKKKSYFTSSYRSERRLKKEVQNHFKLFDTTPPYLAISCGNLPLLNLRKKRKYQFDKEEGLFLTPSKNRKKKGTPIPNHTYLSLGKQILRNLSFTGGSKMLSNKQYEEMGLAIDIEQKSAKRMPYLKVLWVVSGYRLKLLRS